MPSLCSSAPTVRPGVSRSMRKAENFSSRAHDFGEDGVEAGDAAVGDPLLFAVEDVVRSVGGKDGAGADVHGVGAGAGLRQTIGADPLAGGELGQVALFLLLGAVPDQGQRGDADVRAKGGRKTGEY